MGLSERKDKQRIGYDPRNLSWSGDKNRFSYKHMTALGWTDDSGIGGADLTGNAKHIGVVHKLDSSGIGMARAMKEGDAVGGQARAGLDDVLRRLAGGSSSPAPVVVPIPVANNRIASRRKHLESKRLASSSPAALAEILGISTPVKVEDVKPILEDIKPTPTQLDIKPTLTDITPKREAEDMVSTSTLSVHEYFRQKMRAKAVARQIAAGETPTIEPVVPEQASSSKVAWEGVKVEFAETETPLAFSDSPLPLGLTETKEERRAAKAQRKAEKEAKRAVKAERKVAEGVQEEGLTKKKRKRDQSAD